MIYPCGIPICAWSTFPCSPLLGRFRNNTIICRTLSISQSPTSCHTCANSSDAAANPKYIAKKNVTIRLFMVEITATAAKIKRNNRYQSDLLVQKMGCTTRARNPRRVIAESIPSGYQHQNCSSSKKNRMLLMPGT